MDNRSALVILGTLTVVASFTASLVITGHGNDASIAIMLGFVPVLFAQMFTGGKVDKVDEKMDKVLNGTMDEKIARVVNAVLDDRNVGHTPNASDGSGNGSVTDVSNPE